MNNDRWAFAKEMYLSPLSLDIRCAYSDWLAEQGSFVAAKKQQEYIRHLANAIMLKDTVHGYRVYCKGKKGKILILKIKMDGACAISPYTISFALLKYSLKDGKPRQDDIKWHNNDFFKSMLSVSS